MEKSSHFISTSIHFCILLLVLVSQCCYLKCDAANGVAIGSDNNNTIMCVEEDRVALLKFKQGITDDYCRLMSSWGNHQNCCEWSGVRCDNHTGRVTMLNLRGGEEDYQYYSNCLEGRVSSSLVDLKHLTYLDLSINNFSTQSIPKFIGSLTNLKHLNLSECLFEGEIPHQLGNLSSLISLDLSYNGGLYVNDLSWVSHLKRLRSLNLSRVDLSRATNWLHNVNNLPFLNFLHLDGCQLPPPTFPVPLSYKNSTATLSFLSLSHNNLNSTIFEWLFNLSGINTHLAYLDLSWNNLQGSIPTSFGDMHSLSYLDFSWNNLQGNIPTSFGDIHSLSYLDFSGNNLQSLPKTLGNLCSLQQLNLYQNNLTDELPNIIQSLNGCANKSLVSLDLSYNQIWGSVPDSIGDFSSLTRLDLGQNKLNGTISEHLGQLSMLDHLDLSSNYLEDTLSSIHFSNMSRLSTLDLSNNTALTLNISANWVPLFQLDYIDLSNCRLGPLFPKWIITQTKYSSLDLSNAGISDSIEGAIPMFPNTITSLLLNNNKFSNPLPFLCPKSISGLAEIDLSNNLLYGELPDCWMNFPNLTILHLENNRFYGVIPSSVSYLTHLKVLHLRNNSITGGMQRLLKNLTSLVVLDLAHNSLNGHIPPSIGSHFESLCLLNLQNNKFDGVIPKSLCQMSFLQILDFSSNNFTGSIPKCISNFSAMQNGTDLLPSLDYRLSSTVYHQYRDSATLKWKKMERSFGESLGLVKQIDLSNNKLYGEIPNEISYLKGLKSLDLSRNNLRGGITPKIGELTALEFLDVSSNHLTGEIPASLIDLNFLGTFNVSNNNLSGKIPPGTQLEGFDASAYMGNPGLCGLPLPKCSWDRSPNNSLAIDVSPQDVKESDDDFVLGLCISVVLGFIIGFWGVCGTLVLKRSWRLAFFRSFDDMRGKICGGVSMIMARVRRRQ